MSHSVLLGIGFFHRGPSPDRVLKVFLLSVQRLSLAQLELQDFRVKYGGTVAQPQIADAAAAVGCSPAVVGSADGS